MNWINYFEKYSSDRMLLASIEAEIGRLEHYGKESNRLDSLRSAASSLKSSVLSAEAFLDDYVTCASCPKEAGRRAQERLYLKLRYRQGLTMEATAEAMDVSRDTAYRIRRRIIGRGDIFSADPHSTPAARS